MNFFLFIFFVVIILWIFTILFRLLVQKYLAKKYPDICSINQNLWGYSFNSINLKLGDIKIIAKDFTLTPNPLGLFTPKKTLVDIQSKVLLITFEKLPEPINNGEKMMYKTSIIRQSIYIVILSLVKKIKIKFDHLEIKTNSISVAFDNFILDYTKTNTFSLKGGINKTLISLFGFNFEISPFEIEQTFPTEAIYSLINFEAILIPLSYAFEAITIGTNEKSVILDDASINLSIPRGDLIINLPKLNILTPFDLPNLSFSIEKADGFISFPLVNIEYMNLHVAKLNIDKIIFKVINRPLFKIENIQVRSEEHNWVSTIDKLSFDYDSIIGNHGVPFIKKIYGIIMDQPGRENDPGRIDFDMPDMEMKINTVHVGFMFCDTAFVSIDFNDGIYNEKTLHVEKASMHWNKAEAFTFQEFKFTFNHGAYLSAKEVNFFDHQDQYHVFLHDCINGWHLISPRGVSRGETLPFPVNMKVDLFNLNFYDTPIHSTLANAQQKMKKVLEDAYVREFLLNSRKDEMNEAQYQEALKKLNKMKFAQFRGAKAPKFIEEFKMQIIKPTLSLDSTGLSDRENFVYKVDPYVKDFEPDIKWETLLFVYMKMTFEEIYLNAYDIPDHVSYANQVLFDGLLCLGERYNEKQYYTKLQIQGETFDVSTNPCDVKAYCDLKVTADIAYMYSGDPFEIIWGYFCRRMDILVPVDIDTSASMKWYDFFRSKARGKYLLKANRIEFRYPAEETYRELNEYMPISFYGFEALCTQGVISVTADKWLSQRVTKGLNGPAFLELPGIFWVLNIDWTCDSKNYLFRPDPDQFGIESYDTYGAYRASGITIHSELNITGTKSAPTVLCDIAHIKWFFKAMLLFFNTPKYLGDVREAIGYTRENRWKCRKLGDLVKRGSLRIRANTVAARLFDHFPHNIEKASATSIDCRLTDLVANIFIQEKIDFNVKASSISLNASDLNYYAHRSDSQTFVLIENMDCTKGTESFINIEKISGYVNQLFIRYLSEYVSSIMKLLPPIQTDKKKFEDFDTARELYSQKDGTLNISTIILQADSLETDLSCKLELKHLTGSLNSDGNGRFAIDGQLDLGVFSDNGPGIFSNLFQIENINLFAASPTYFLEFSSLNVTLTPENFSSATMLARELFPISLYDQSKNTIETSSDDNSKLYIKLTAQWTTINMTAVGVQFALLMADKIKFSYKQEMDGSKDIVFTASSIVANNLMPNAAFPTAITPWNQGRRLTDHMLMHIKTAPPVNGAIVVQQVEINIQPTIICYETRFRDSIVNLLSFTLQKRPFVESHTIGKKEWNLPFIQFPPETIPPVDSHNLVSKSKNLDVVKSPEVKTFLFRYFHVSPIALNASYRNPDNRLITEINDFHGLMAEVTYHDLTATIMDLIEKMSLDIGLDMIPQFLKHVVGLKNDLSKELSPTSIEKKDEDSVSNSEQQKAIIFGSKTVKKK